MTPYTPLKERQEGQPANATSYVSLKERVMGVGRDLTKPIPYTPLNLRQKPTGFIKAAGEFGQAATEGLGDVVDIASGVPGKAVGIATGQPDAVPWRFSEQVGRATEELTGSKKLGSFATAAALFAEPFPGGKGKSLSKLKELEGLVFASPNIKEGLDFNAAEKLLTSSEHARMRSVYADVTKEAGFTSKDFDAVGGWKDGAENTIYSELKGAKSLADVERVGAARGLASYQKGVINFFRNPAGKDRVYMIDLPNTAPEQVLASLQKQGIEYYTKVGSKWIVFDSGGGLRKNFNSLANEYGTRAEELRGEGSFIGGDTRIEGKRAYRDILNRGEGLDGGHDRQSGLGRSGDVGATNSGQATIGALAGGAVITTAASVGVADYFGVPTEWAKQTMEAAVTEFPFDELALELFQEVNVREKEFSGSVGGRYKSRGREVYDIARFILPGKVAAQLANTSLGQRLDAPTLQLGKDLEAPLKEIASHELLHHAFESMVRDNGMAPVQSFDEEWGKIDDEFLAEIDDHIRSTGLPEDDRHAWNDERYAYLGQKALYAGIAAIPIPLRKFYGGIIKGWDTDTKYNRQYRLFQTPQDDSRAAEREEAEEYFQKLRKQDKP